MFVRTATSPPQSDTLKVMGELEQRRPPLKDQAFEHLPSQTPQVHLRTNRRDATDRPIQHYPR